MRDIYTEVVLRTGVARQTVKARAIYRMYSYGAESPPEVTPSQIIRRLSAELGYKLYRGFIVGAVPRYHNVQILCGDGGVHPLDPRMDLIDHSPDGFCWGYRGSGPAQLALALLADATGDDDLAVELHRDFKQEVVADWDTDNSWTCEWQFINDWARRHGNRAESGT